ncbi:heavy-metal-associated domain-containing protein [Geoalkalibacter halelectricus]|uniref:Heavy-metal-associated domain-containing protein n=1 Tax=Geoalkalibacter halelectricus TaxID=2847045 RepID=A0ABY5ZJH3_9BACT|nr:heavy metal-associated domain-containing protein [Geoalkalibacter halelectricus]MDO3379364.1 heavy-metal-associated domain-containing protein [Geoalkalibacter halelectricus]UWZ78758.1 heavy-metal-associated domain-containing protein [Geoalkalibacter halelectricus]
MKSRWLVSLVLVLVAVAAAYAVFGQRSSEATTFAELRVQGMTCGACSGRVQKAARGLPGVGSVEVNLAAGSARVAFDPQRIDAERIAFAVSEAGYPAQLLSVMDLEQIQAEQQAQRELAVKYVGQIGERLVSREEFGQYLVSMTGGTPDGFISPAVAGQAWRNLVQRELLLADAAASAVAVSAEEAREEIETMRQSMPNFDQLAAARFGSLEAFVERLRSDLTISRHLEQNVINGEQDPRLRQMLVERRVQEIGVRIPVRIFDPMLNNAGRGGCC